MEVRRPGDLHNTKTASQLTEQILTAIFQNQGFIFGCFCSTQGNIKLLQRGISKEVCSSANKCQCIVLFQLYLMLRCDTLYFLVQPKINFLSLSLSANHILPRLILSESLVILSYFSIVLVIFFLRPKLLSYRFIFFKDVSFLLIIFLVEKYIF